MIPHRVQLRRTLGWRLPANTIVVARPSKWGNPFIVGKHGDRSRCVELFRLLITGHIAIGMDKECVDAQLLALSWIQNNWRQLQGKNLACWCRLDGKPCHADVLLEIANQ